MRETTTLLPIAIWYRPGEMSPVYAESYTNAVDADIQGNGMNVLTPLPAFDTPIVLPARTTHTFYVTTSKNGEEAMYYGEGTELGKAYVSDDFLEISEGYAMRYSFSSPMFPKQWNGKPSTFICIVEFNLLTDLSFLLEFSLGVIYYTATAPPPTTTSSPTKSPTQKVSRNTTFSHAKVSVLSPVSSQY